MLNDDDWTLPHMVAEALGRTGDPRVIETLAEHLYDNSQDRFSRGYAARALAKIGGDEARRAA